MTFLEAAFLVGLGAVSIPIAIHLIDRRRARPLPFPTLRFLREADQRASRRARLTEIVVLLLRATAIAALALAFARPVLHEGLLGRGRVSRILVIDDSLGMRARVAGASAFELARRAARRLLRALEPAERGAVLSAVGVSRSPGALSENRSALERSLDELEVSWRPTPLGAALRRALALAAESPDPVREVLVISDLAGGALADLAAPLSLPERTRLILLKPRGLPTVNAALRSARAERRGEKLRATCRIEAEGEGKVSLRLRLLVGGSAIEERAVRVAAGAGRDVIVELDPPSSGVDRARFEIRGDRFDGDDTLEFALPPGEGARRVLCARDPARGSGASDPSFWFRRALAAVPGRWRVEVAGLAGLAQRDLRGFEAVVLLEPARLAEATGRRLASWVAAGGGLLLTCGPAQGRAALDGLVRAGDRIAPALLEDVVRRPSDPVHLASVSEEHALWRPLLAARPPLRPAVPSFTSYRRLVSEDEGRVLARFSTRDPALVAREVGRGRVLLFASSFSIDWGDLPLKFLFAPLVDSALDWLAPGRLRSELRRPGDEIVLRLFEPGGAGRVRVSDPEGRRRIVEPAAARAAPGAGRGDGGDERAIDLGRAEAPGLFIVDEERPGGTTRRAISVRPDPSESDPTPIPLARIERLLPEARLVEFATGGEALDAVRALTVGSELRGWLLALLLLLLVLEPLVANRSARRSGERGGGRSRGRGGGRGGGRSRGVARRSP